MRYKKLMYYVKKWQSAGLISEEQAAKIIDYMKIEAHRQLIRLIRVLFVMGAFWVIFGLAASLRLINAEIFVAIGRLLYELATPFINLAKALSPENYPLLLGGVGCLLGWGLFFWIGMRLRGKSGIQMTRLGYLQEQGLRLGTSALTLSYILAAAAWQCFNYMLYPKDAFEYFGDRPLFPFFSVLGMVFFIILAYRMQDQIALLFGIGFLGQAIGLFTTYWFACYGLGVQFPLVQLTVGMFLLFVGLYHIDKLSKEEDNFLRIFGKTYEWTGLLFVFLSLWIMSIWGPSFDVETWTEPTASQLWMTNLAFIGVSLFVLFYGAAQEDKVFFNYGLTFLIIDTYTLFFSRLWDTIGAAFGTLLLGLLLIGTAYLLRHLWLTGRLFKKTSQ